VPRGRGPWLEVSLEDDAHTTLAGALEHSPTRMMTVGTVTANLRAVGEGEPAEVLVDGVVVGHLDTHVAGEVRGQIGRLAGPDRYLLQVQLP
jgi:hypothetical protein